MSTVRYATKDIKIHVRYVPLSYPSPFSDLKRSRFLAQLKPRSSVPHSKVSTSNRESSFLLSGRTIVSSDFLIMKGCGDESPKVTWAMSAC